MITSPCAPSPDRYGALKQQPHITLALLLGHAADAPLLDHFSLTLRGLVGTGGGAKHIIYSTGILAIVEGRMAMVSQAMPPPQQPGRAEEEPPPLPSAYACLPRQDPQTGIASISRLFEALGYRGAECYNVRSPPQPPHGISQEIPRPVRLPLWIHS